MTAIGFSAAFLGLPLVTVLPVTIRDGLHQDIVFYARLRIPWLSLSPPSALLGRVVSFCRVTFLGGSSRDSLASWMARGQGRFRTDDPDRQRHDAHYYRAALLPGL